MVEVDFPEVSSADAAQVWEIMIGRSHNGLLELTSVEFNLALQYTIFIHLRSDKAEPKTDKASKYRYKKFAARLSTEEST